MSNAQIQKPDLCWQKIPKSLEKSRSLHKKKFPEWFGHKTIGPIGFHDNVVIIQCKLMFKKKRFQSDFKVIWYTLMYFWTFWVHS